MSDDHSGTGGTGWKGQIQEFCVDGSRLDEVLDLLADRHRRYTIYCLVCEDAAVFDYETVCAYLTDRCPDVGGREEQKIVLHHETLPRLAEAGVVEYDSRSETIRYLGREDLTRMVDVIGAVETGRR